MTSLTVAPSSALVAGRAYTAKLPGQPKGFALHQRTRRSLTKVSLVDTGYVLADAVGKAADKADKVVGSVNAPGWVLPVS